MQKLRMEHIYKSYGHAVVLQDFSYAFTPGGITCIMGESGAGKTTLLRLLMGLEKADSGIITGFDKVSAVFQENRPKGRCGKDTRLCVNQSAVSSGPSRFLSLTLR